MRERERVVGVLPATKWLAWYWDEKTQKPFSAPIEAWIFLDMRPAHPDDCPCEPCLKHSIEVRAWAVDDEGIWMDESDHTFNFLRLAPDDGVDRELDCRRIWKEKCENMRRKIQEQKETK